MIAVVSFSISKEDVVDSRARRRSASMRSSRSSARSQPSSPITSW
jgi:hypothetical protein